MKAVDLLRCSQPLTFVQDVAGYELSAAGTCFIVKLANRHWVVTATHAHAMDGKRDASLLVPRGDDCLDGLALGGAIEIRSTDAFDNAFADLTIFEVIEPLAHEPGLAVLDLDEYAFVQDFADALPGDDVLASGYPLSGLDNEIDYDQRSVKRQRFLASRGERARGGHRRACCNGVRCSAGRCEVPLQ